MRKFLKRPTALISIMWLDIAFSDAWGKRVATGSADLSMHRLLEQTRIYTVSGRWALLGMDCSVEIAQD